MREGKVMRKGGRGHEGGEVMREGGRGHEGGEVTKGAPHMLARKYRAAVAPTPAHGGGRGCVLVCQFAVSGSASQVNLPSGVANVSFVGRAGVSFRSDMAIDSVVLSHRGQTHCEHWQL